MAYKISYGKAVIEVATDREFREALATLGIIEPQRQIALPLDAPVNGVNGANPYRAMYRRAKVPQRSLLDALASADWIRDKELRTLVGIEGNLQLAGMWLGVVKNAHHCGLRPDQVFRKWHTTKGADAGYWYQMTNEAKEALKQP